MNRFGVKRVLLLSMAIVVLGNALLTQISATGNVFGIEPGMILWSLGASIGFPALFIVALSGTKPGEEGLASELITTSQRVGFPLGLAVLVAIASLVSPQPIGDGSPSLAVVTGFRYAFVATAILGGIGLVIAFRIKEPKNSHIVTKSSS